MINSHHLTLSTVPHSFTALLFAADAAVCQICGARYSQRSTLWQHLKKHFGQTRCLVCHKEYQAMRNLRRHMVTNHGMSKEEVDRITNKRPQVPRNYWTLKYGGQSPAVPNEPVISTATMQASLDDSAVPEEQADVKPADLPQSDTS